MADRTLSAAQVASMLVSTSCGIGFLLGTGELAVHQGMAGCLYAVATSLGLLILAVCAPVLWRDGQSVWAQFDRLYGPSVGRNVALLSLVWMTGVLAAQIRGGRAVLSLTGMPRISAVWLIIVLLVALSLVRLTWLSAGFAFCLLSSNLILMHSLTRTGSLHIWLHAPAIFAEAIPHAATLHTGFVLLSVAVMVICGADYQQFAIAARRPSTARTGALLAAAFVFAIGFLPASAVIGAGGTEHGFNVTVPLQVVPVLLTHSLPGGTTRATRDIVVIVLVATALGSASSILRAMSDATATLGPRSTFRPIWSRALPVLLGTLVATRAQTLVDTMVDLNVVYIAAVGPLLVLSMLRVRVPDYAANAAMATACAISLGGYLIRWTAAAAPQEAWPLALAVVAASAVALWYRPRVIRSSALPLRQERGCSAQRSSEGRSICSGKADGG